MTRWELMQSKGLVCRWYLEGTRERQSGQATGLGRDISTGGGGVNQNRRVEGGPQHRWRGSVCSPGASRGQGWRGCRQGDRQALSRDPAGGPDTPKQGPGLSGHPSPGVPQSPFVPSAPGCDWGPLPGDTEGSEPHSDVITTQTTLPPPTTPGWSPCVFPPHSRHPQLLLPNHKDGARN